MGVVNTTIIIAAGLLQRIGGSESGAHNNLAGGRAVETRIGGRFGSAQRELCAEASQGPIPYDDTVSGSAPSDNYRDNAIVRCLVSHSSWQYGSQGGCGSASSACGAARCGAVRRVAKAPRRVPLH